MFRDRSDDESSDDQEDSDSDYDGGHKAVESSSEDEIEENFEEESDDGNFEIDESQLEGLTELEREKLISEYAEKRQQALERKEVKKRLAQSRRSSGIAAKRDRKTRDTSKAKSQKQKKLQELKAKRSGKKSKLDYDDADDEDLEDESSAEYMARMRKQLHASDAPSSKSAENGIKVDDLRLIQVTRDQLERWVYAPFLREVIVGLFVRLGLGADKQNKNQYRVCEIVGVEEYHRVYKVNTTQCKYSLVLRHGKAEKTFLMDIISNSPFTEQEFERWFKVMSVEKQRVISKNLVNQRQETLEQARTRAYTEDEVSQMVAERQKHFSVPTNLAMKKVQLENELAHAREVGDHESVQELSGKVQDIAYQMETGEQDKKVDVWAKLNERNRLKNLHDVSQAEQITRQERIGAINETSRTKKSAATAAAKFDPFARIKAAPTQIFTEQELLDKESGETTPMEDRRSSLHAISPLLSVLAPSSMTATTTTESDAFDILADIEIDI